MATSGDILAFTIGEEAANLPLLGKATDAAKPPTMHRTAPTIENYPTPNVKSAKAERPDLAPFSEFDLIGVEWGLSFSIKKKVSRWSNPCLEDVAELKEQSARHPARRGDGAGDAGEEMDRST